MMSGVDGLRFGLARFWIKFERGPCTKKPEPVANPEPPEGKLDELSARTSQLRNA